MQTLEILVRDQNQLFFHPHVTIQDLLMSPGQVKRQVKLLLCHAMSQISHASYADQHAAAKKGHQSNTGRIEYKWCSEQILVCERLSHCQGSSKVANIQSHHGPTSQCFESWHKRISKRSKFNMQLVGCRMQSSRKHQNKAENKACKHWRFLCATKISCFSSTCHYSWLVNERRTSQATSQATTIPCHEPN